MIDKILSTGDLFLLPIFSGILLIPQEKRSEQLEEKFEEVSKLVGAGETISIKTIIEKYNCDVKTAHLIIKKLYEKGIITPIEK